MRRRKILFFDREDWKTLKNEFRTIFLGGFSITWNFLKEDTKYFGCYIEWYDGPRICFGLWYFHLVLSSDVWPGESFDECLYKIHNHKEALREVVKAGPGVHLLSSNKIIRAIAQEEIDKKDA